MGQGQSSGGPTPSNGEVMPALVVEAPSKLLRARFVDVFVPKPEGEEVRVRIFSVGINPVDVQRCSAKGAEFPCVLGSDFAGVVDAIGERVHNWKVGDKVYGHINVTKQYGTFTHYTLVPSSVLAPMPQGLSFAQAAAIPCSGWAAYIALYYKFRVQQHQTILVTGAGGGVASFAIPLCKLSGLTVFAITSPHKTEYVRSLGADHIFTTEMDEKEISELISSATGGQLLDFVLDTVGPSSAAGTLQFLKVNGAICSLSGQVTDPEVFKRALSVHYVNLCVYHESLPQFLQSVGTDIGVYFLQHLKVPVMEECKFDQIPSALKAVDDHTITGKVVANVVPKHQQEDVYHNILKPAEVREAAAPVSALPVKFTAHASTAPITTPIPPLVAAPALAPAPAVQEEKKPVPQKKNSGGWLF